MSKSNKTTITLTFNWGVTKHRNGMERNGIYRNKPEYTGTRQNDAGMKRNGQEWCRNETEWTRLVPECTGTSRNDIGIY